MTHNIEVVVMGGSAGGIDALSTIFRALPQHFSLPVVLVLHVPPDRQNYLVEVLGSVCPRVVKEAEDKEPLTSGVLYVAPPNYHLLLERNRSLSLSADAKVHFSRPSIDVLFESAADACGARVAGVLLTGANDDGAHGLARIKAAGGMTLVQDPETAAMRTMPEAALRQEPRHRVASLINIASALGELSTPGAMGRQA